MLEEWMQLAAHMGYFTVAVWFVVPVLAIIGIAWWLLDLRYESRGDQRRYLRKAMPISGAGVLAVMVVWGARRNARSIGR